MTEKETLEQLIDLVDKLPLSRLTLKDGVLYCRIDTFNAMVDLINQYLTEQNTS